MTLLSHIQDVCDNVGLSRPSAVITSGETKVRQLLALSNKVGRNMARRHPWTALNREFTHTTLAAEFQGLVESIMTGYNWALNQTFWNRSQQDHAFGPLSPMQWQANKAVTYSGPFQEFRIKEKGLYLYPAPPAGETFAGEYVSRYWCESSGGTDQDKWAADTDVMILDEHLLTLGVIAEWLKSKGLPYAEAMRDYEFQLADAIIKDGAKPVLSLGQSDYYQPSIRAPEGSWSV